MRLLVPNFWTVVYAYIFRDISILKGIIFLRGGYFAAYFAKNSLY